MNERANTSLESQPRQYDAEVKPRTLSDRDYIIAVLALVAALLLFVYIVWKICNSPDCSDPEYPPQLESTRRGIKRLGSKSVAIIVKVPSLAESSVISSEENMVPIMAESGAKSSTQSTKRNVDRVESKSLKLSECRKSDVKGKISFET